MKSLLKVEQEKQLSKGQKQIAIYCEGKRMLWGRCDRIKVGCLANTIECPRKGDNCKNCESVEGFANSLCLIAHDWAWFGGGKYTFKVK